MSQAAVDLPDPLEKSADPLANPDDLLSQMAGNEIDRLLAEADAKPAAPAAASPAPTAESAAGAPEQSVDAQLENLFQDLKAQDKVQPAELSKAVDAELAEKAGEVIPPKGEEKKPFCRRQDLRTSQPPRRRRPSNVPKELKRNRC